MMVVGQRGSNNSSGSHCQTIINNCDLQNMKCIILTTTIVLMMNHLYKGFNHYYITSYLSTIYSHRNNINLNNLKLHQTSAYQYI